MELDYVESTTLPSPTALNKVDTIWMNNLPPIGCSNPTTSAQPAPEESNNSPECLIDGVEFEWVNCRLRRGYPGIQITKSCIVVPLVTQVSNAPNQPLNTLIVHQGAEGRGGLWPIRRQVDRLKLGWSIGVYSRDEVGE